MCPICPLTCGVGPYLCHIVTSVLSHSPLLLSDNIQAWVVLVLLWLLSVECDGRGRRGRRGKRWHVAGSEEDCGQSAQLTSFHHARPASLCQNSQVRILTTVKLKFV